MPYIITTDTPSAPSKWNAPHTMTTRTAVATLDEAREAAEDVVTRAQGDTFEASDERFDCRELPEVGGTVGPLPDGTVIEVRPATPAELWADAGKSGFPLSHQSAIAAFNAA